MQEFNSGVDVAQGPSLVEPKPAWQNGVAGTGSTRSIPDLASDADPYTGVAVYGPVGGNTSAWLVFGGTSVSSPIIAGVYALAGNAGALHFGEHSYHHLQDLFTVHAGTNESCRRVCRDSRGFNGSTGNGTPDGVGAF